MGELYRLDFISGKSYIGITRKTAAERFYGHLKAVKNSAKGIVYHAWRKYGDPKLTVLAVLDNKELCEAEIKAIKSYNTKYPHGYNITDGGDSPPSLNPDVAKKISNALKGRKVPEETRLRIAESLKGRKHTTQSKDKMSISQKGIKPSEEAKKRMSNAAKGREYSNERKLKMAKAQQDRRRREGFSKQPRREAQAYLNELELV